MVETISDKTSEHKRLLLFSTPRPHGEQYLDSCLEPVREFLGETDEVLFIPYAHADHDGYARAVREKFGQLAIDLISIHEMQDPQEAVHNAQAVFVGGGNTFRLLKSLYDHDLISVVREVANRGVPYIGASAGTVVAGQSIRSWEEMPVVLPPTTDALGLTPFDIRPHLIDTPTEYTVGNPVHKRIRDLHQESETSVVALYERAYILATNTTCVLGGNDGAVVFRRHQEPQRYHAGEMIDVE